MIVVPVGTNKRKGPSNRREGVSENSGYIVSVIIVLAECNRRLHL